MSCTGCTAKFNFFHKEMSCPNCGFSFCGKCLKQKCKVPAKGDTEQHVCKKCYARLAAGSSMDQEENIPPPDTFLKRLENLDNPSAPPITVYRHDAKLEQLRSGLSPADKAIVDRLEKLREERRKTPPPSEYEIRKRLASLKGENNYVEEPKKTLLLSDKRSDQEKADSLLEQYMKEKDIELSHNPEEGIEARLADLRGQGVRPNEGSYIRNLHDSSSSEEDVEKITKKIMSEVNLDKKCARKMSVDEDDGSDADVVDSDPLPWCVICNEDAQVKCLDCSDDLYCLRCVKEAHDNWCETEHRIVPFKK